jgi:hypothetical protein
MTDDIEELNRMLDVLINKLRYYQKIKDNNIIKGINKNIKIIKDRLEELKK